MSYLMEDAYEFVELDLEGTGSLVDGAPVGGAALFAAFEDGVEENAF